MHVYFGALHLKEMLRTKLTSLIQRQSRVISVDGFLHLFSKGAAHRNI
jgi:hypothetical protein